MVKNDRNNFKFDLLFYIPKQRNLPTSRVGKLKVILISYYEYIFFTQVFFIYPEVIHNNASIKIDIWKCKIWEVVGKTFLVNAFCTWRNICATKLYLYVTSGYGEVSINTTNVVWDKVVTMQPNTTNYNSKRK